ncbi:MAG: methyltransferase domain-containing protein [Draconibacterium sp.]|nr:methyltransferase domain-containing protein [Draconibacterium sp.]
MTGEILKIDLGCGPNKKEGFRGMDILPLPGVDYVINLEEGFNFIGNNSVDEFYSSHFLEHVQNFELILSEIHRTLKPGGLCTVIVPHFSNPYYYSDYTHKRFFGYYSFDYLSKPDKKVKRRVPVYNSEVSFEILHRKLVFKAPRFRVINLFKKHVIQRIFNLSPYFQEVYEALFTNTFTCYEIHFILKKSMEE